ncbi:MAG: hypothetical protein ACE5KE_05250 [Methanosarcinales archaeon]
MNKIRFTEKREEHGVEFTYDIDISIGFRTDAISIIVKKKLEGTTMKITHLIIQNDGKIVHIHNK